VGQRHEGGKMKPPRILVGLLYLQGILFTLITCYSIISYLLHSSGTLASLILILALAFWCGIPSLVIALLITLKLKKATRIVTIISLILTAAFIITAIVFGITIIFLIPAATCILLQAITLLKVN